MRKLINLIPEPREAPVYSAKEMFQTRLVEGVAQLVAREIPVLKVVRSSRAVLTFSNSDFLIFSKSAQYSSTLVLRLYTSFPFILERTPRNLSWHSI
jgi:hypothetical protein